MSLKGSLETVGLAEVLQFLASTGKSGEFHLAGEGGGEGRLWFDAGLISGFEAGASQAPFEAIFELLRFARGEFEFAPDTARPYHIEPVDGEDREVEPAIRRAEARLEEWRSIVAGVPSLAHWAYLATELPCEEVTLRAAQWCMIGTIGSGRIVGEVIAERGLREFEGCKVIKELVDADLVRVGEAPPAPAPLGAPGEPAGVVGSQDGAGWAGGPELPGGSEQDGGAGDWFSSDGSYDPFAAAPAEEAAPEAVPAETAATAEETAVEAGEEPAGEWQEEPAAEAEPDPSGRAALEALAAEAAADPYDAADPYGYEGGEPATDPYDPAAVLTDPYIVGDRYGDDDAGPDQAPDGPDRDAAVDGLADRGPWTAGELAEIGSWADPGAAPDGSVPDGSVPAGDGTGFPAVGGYDPVEHGLGQYGSAGGYEATVAEDEASAAYEAAETEPEPEAPVEEPINRGLLLKFLSSVRN